MAEDSGRPNSEGIALKAGNEGKVSCWSGRDRQVLAVKRNGGQDIPPEEGSHCLQFRSVDIIMQAVHRGVES